MGVREQLIRILADGRAHTGTELAADLGVTRSAVWKQVHRLGELGLELQPVAGRGYRLVSPLELLDRERILAALQPASRAACESLEVRAITGSTSTDLMAQPPPSPGLWRAVLAEFQTGGRGRRGRRWLSAFGSGLCLSVAWSYASAPRDLPALALAAGIGVRRALAAAGSPDVRLKWPNDLMLDGRKLGGILVDVDGDARGPLRAVIGIGVNVSVPEGLARDIAAQGGLPPAGLCQVNGGHGLARNGLAAAVIGALLDVLQQFGVHGFTPLADEWRRNDYLYGRAIRVTRDGLEIAGVAGGIAPDGALLVQAADGLAAVFNGEVSVREGP